MYKVIVKFKDKEDNHIYNVGDTYPATKRKVNDKRLEELLTDKNRRKKVLIEEVVKKEAPKKETKKTKEK